MRVKLMSSGNSGILIEEKWAISKTGCSSFITWTNYLA